MTTPEARSNPLRALWPLCLGALALVGCSTSGGGNEGTASGGNRAGTGGATAGSGTGGRGYGSESDGGEPSLGGGGGGGGGGATGGGAVTATGGANGATGGAAGSAPDASVDSVVDTATNETPAASPLGPAGGACPVAGSYPDPVPAGATATLVKGGFIFTEGPVWVASEKALFFTEFDEDAAIGRINRYDPVSGSFGLFFQGIGVNGLAIDERGGLVGASHGIQGITRFDLATKMRVPIAGGEQFEGKKFNSPNDLVVRTDGNIYFSDPSYQRPANSAGQGVTAFYRWKDGQISRHGAGPQPNAMGLSLDGQSLYVTSSMAPPVRKFALAADGSVGAATTFVNMISQGFALDCAGNVYLTAERRVHVFSPGGQMRGTIGGFPQDLTNLAFGDEDRKTLYITARPGSLYKVRLEVPGFPN